MKPTVVIQARMGSTRLPGKVLLPILGRPMLWHIVDRAKAVPGITGVVVATSDKPADDAVGAFCVEYDIACFRGSETDVLDRFYRAAKHFEADPVIRVTGDCPLIDPELVGRLLELYMEGDCDHVGIATGAGAALLDGGRYPDGLDAECFGFSTLERTWEEAVEPADREHVTPYIWRTKGRFRLGSIRSKKDYSDLRWTVDNSEDFLVVSRIYEKLYRTDRHFLMEDVVTFISRNPDVGNINRRFVGREAYGELWEEPHDDV